MSAFICAKCDRLSDADDGCEATEDLRLICIGCVVEEEDDDETPHP